MGRPRLYSDEERKQRHIEADRRCRETRREKYAARDRERAKARPMDSKYAAVKRWRDANPWYMRAMNAKRKAAKLQQTPKWADITAIEQFYKDCPVGLTVDHVIPLQGEEVRGLHVLNNLQYLTKSENSRKGNRVKVGY